ncbi:permease [Alkalimarinus sediminis]|uniref:Permease n=1 Tax=Alkalimarinus sediminis TaxID=1632866 RepID=A0A9E8HPD9_9ALTE|nr:permease [Alkalimarinus sediminis]UZW76308.1 permease [Alkalimarinus sediminis]
MLAFIERFSHAFMGMLYEMAPFLVIGVVAAGLVHESLGRFQRLRHFAQKRTILSLSFFNLSGLILPICSCGTVPMAVSMRGQGVPYGNLFSFIFSAPATSIAAIILSIALLGAEFTLYYIIGAIVCSYIIGFTFFALEPKATIQDNLYIPTTINAASSEGHSDGSFIVRSIKWATTVYGSRIAFDLILGLLLVALLVSSFSLTNLSGWLDDLPFLVACLIMILLAIPMYICSLPGIMLGSTMILSGVKPELVWVFLMAGPVTNLGDLNVLRKSMGNKPTALYVGLVVTTTIAWAYLIHIQIDWMDVWGHVRQYFAQQPALLVGSEQSDYWSQNSVLPSWPWLYWGSTILVVMLVLNGAYLTLKEFFTNPCLHCTHFQSDMALNPVVCQHPCWKKNTFRRWKQFQKKRKSRVVRFDPTKN